jgi:nucleoside-diphosphate-sugar epimerase
MIEFGTDLVLVTGANGWLGRNLVQTLLKGDPDCELLRQPQRGLNIRTLILPGQNRTFLEGLAPQVEVVEGDLTNPDRCRRFVEGAQDSILFHTAGIIHPKRVKQYYQVNVRGTQNLLQAAVQAKVRRAVVVSSNSPCGTNPHPDHLFDEDCAYNPYMNYGRSKVEMELAIKQHQKSGNIETVIIRSPWFYGPHQPARQSLFFQMIRDGKIPIVGSGENLRSMAYVGNICQGLILAALSEKANGQTYWIADDHPYTMNEIVSIVETLLENEFGQTCAHRRLRLPSVVSEIALFADAILQKLGLYAQKIHVLSEMNKTIACCIDKARDELGYDPKVELTEGMRRSLKWCTLNAVPI